MRTFAIALLLLPVVAAAHSGHGPVIHWHADDIAACLALAGMLAGAARIARSFSKRGAR